MTIDNRGYKGGIKMRSLKYKKSVMGQVLNIFVLMLLIIAFTGMAFLFSSQFKEQIKTTASDGDNSTAYKAVNTTEAAGFNTTKFFSMLFLAMIFGAILLVLLKVILPYVNLGRQMEGW
ncbi:MAG: hypothetical protein ACFFG0_07995 [Candidatus Thorarchaeota archaeon]